MKKRILAALLALSMIAMAAVSCGDDQGSSSQSSSSSTASGGTSGDVEEEIVTEITLPISEEKMTFTEWRSWSNDYLTNYGEVLGAQKIEELTNIHIEYTCVPQTAATEKYGLLLASGEYIIRLKPFHKSFTLFFPFCTSLKYTSSPRPIGERKYFS